jgi:hypothetical protein
MSEILSQTGDPGPEDPEPLGSRPHDRFNEIVAVSYPDGTPNVADIIVGLDRTTEEILFDFLTDGQYSESLEKSRRRRGLN